MFITGFEKIATNMQKCFEKCKNFEFDLKISSHQFNVSFNTYLCHCFCININYYRVKNFQLFIGKVFRIKL
jgi:hypothetical protein